MTVCGRTLSGLAVAAVSSLCPSSAPGCVTRLYFSLHPVFSLLSRVGWTEGRTEGRKVTEDIGDAGAGSTGHGSLGKVPSRSPDPLSPLSPLSPFGCQRPAQLWPVLPRPAGLGSPSCPPSDPLGFPHQTCSLPPARPTLSTRLRPLPPVVLCCRLFREATAPRGPQGPQRRRCFQPSTCCAALRLFAFPFPSRTRPSLLVSVCASLVPDGEQ